MFAAFSSMVPPDSNSYKIDIRDPQIPLLLKEYLYELPDLSEEIAKHLLE